MCWAVCRTLAPKASPFTPKLYQTLPPSPFLSVLSPVQALRPSHQQAGPLLLLNPLGSSAENLPKVPDVTGVHRDPGMGRGTLSVAMGDEAEGWRRPGK